MRCDPTNGCRRPIIDRGTATGVSSTADLRLLPGCRSRRSRPDTGTVRRARSARTVFLQSATMTGERDRSGPSTGGCAHAPTSAHLEPQRQGCSSAADDPMVALGSHGRAGVGCGPPGHRAPGRERRPGAHRWSSQSQLDDVSRRPARKRGRPHHGVVRPSEARLDVPGAQRPALRRTAGRRKLGGGRHRERRRVRTPCFQWHRGVVDGCRHPRAGVVASLWRHLPECGHHLHAGDRPVAVRGVRRGRRGQWRGGIRIIWWGWG